MPEIECRRCSRPVSDAYVCSLCSRDVEKALAGIPWLSEQLDLTVGRVARFGAQSEGRGAQTPVVFNVAAGEAYDVLRNVLVSWTRLIAEENHGLRDTLGYVVALGYASVELPTDTLPSIARWLLGSVQWMRHHDLAPEFVDEIMAATITARHVVDSPANRTTFAVGPCPEVDEHGAHCPGEVKAYIPSDPDVTATMACRACGGLWEPWQWHRAGRRILARRAERMRGLTSA